MIHVVVEGARLAVAQCALLFAVSLTPLAHPDVRLELVLAGVGIVTGLLWAGGAFDGDRTPWGQLLATAVVASIPGMLLWFDQSGAVASVELLGLLVLPAITAVAAASTRARWTPRVAIDEDPAAAWARHNRERYREGRATGRIPDTVSFNPYAPLGTREVIHEDPWDNAPLDHQVDLGARTDRREPE